ncbi:hypothetical protein LCGC14_1834860 [marine sediment metagenome]|uniref:G8 domain-containing protein n=1 Tax=marine sediment metagenome TaxID=412755 RepID=A0A0F9GEZ6_9ZZZZ
MAKVYWHADGGNWSDHATHWFNATDGGGGGHGAAPGTDDNAIFDANSFDNVSQTVTIDATATCLAMTWTGATNTPTITQAADLEISGSLTTIAAMVWTSTAFSIYFEGTGNVTTNGLTIGCRIYVDNTATNITLIDALNITGKQLGISRGTIDTNDQTVTCATFATTGAGTRTLDLGASTINCTTWTLSGSNLTLTEGTSTIKVTGTGAFTGGGETYNNVELNGTAHTISGSNTFRKLSFGCCPDYNLHRYNYSDFHYTSIHRVVRQSKNSSRDINSRLDNN